MTGDRKCSYKAYQQLERRTWKQDHYRFVLSRHIAATREHKLH